jgi:hypothetical protein
MARYAVAGFLVVFYRAQNRIIKGISLLTQAIHLGTVPNHLVTAILNYILNTNTAYTSDKYHCTNPAEKGHSEAQSCTIDFSGSFIGWAHQSTAGRIQPRASTYAHH